MTNLIIAIIMNVQVCDDFPKTRLRCIKDMANTIKMCDTVRCIEDEATIIWSMHDYLNETKPNEEKK